MARARSDDSIEDGAWQVPKVATLSNFTGNFAIIMNCCLVSRMLVAEFRVKFSYRSGVVEFHVESSHRSGVVAEFHVKFSSSRFGN